MNLYRYIVLLSFPALLMPTGSFGQFKDKYVTTEGHDQSEMAIAVSPLNNNRLIGVWNDFREGSYSKAGYALSTNGGTTWTEGILQPPSTNTGYVYGFDPSISFDRNNNAFYCYIATPSQVTLGATYVARSTDQGATWYDTNIKRVSIDIAGQDKPFMAVDNTAGTYDGYIYVSWTNFNSSTRDIKFARSSNHGSSYDTLTLAHVHLPTNPELPDPDSGAYMLPTDFFTCPSPPTYPFVQGSMPAVAPDGKLYVVWFEAHPDSNTGRFKIRASTNGGGSFGDATNGPSFNFVQTCLGKADIRNLPSLAVAPDSTLCLAYVDQISESDTRLRVKYSRSTNAGSSWSTPIVIWEPGSGSNTEFFPWVCVDANGRINVAFMYSANDTLVDAYLAASTDNGSSFGTPIKVSSQSSNPANSGHTHHYMGATVRTANKIYELWTDCNYSV